MPLTYSPSSKVHVIVRHPSAESNIPFMFASVVFIQDDTLVLLSSHLPMIALAFYVYINPKLKRVPRLMTRLDCCSHTSFLDSLGVGYSLILVYTLSSSKALTFFVQVLEKSFWIYGAKCVTPRLVTKFVVRYVP
jgi:hypothetical protein